MTLHLFRRSIALSLIVFSLLAILPAAAQDTFPPPDGTAWGEPQDMGDGQVQTFITLDEAGVPSLVGISFNEAALSGLPEEPSDGKWDVKNAEGTVVYPCCGHELILEFPETDSPTIFNNFVINWAPTGHVPAGVYDKPHFDMHFYLMSNEDRTAIEAATADTMCSVPNPPDVGGEHPASVTCETFEEASMPLPDDQMPVGYIFVGAVEPGMGNHLVNSQAPEITGEGPFTHTFIFGSYAGKLTFFEPMITLSFLNEKNEEVCTELSLPETMAEPGYYPSQYCIRYMAGANEGEGTYVISLESFVEF
jgi:hypothetical protein